MSGRLHHGRTESPLASLVALTLLLLASGCHGYDPAWHWAPRGELHALHLGAATEPRVVAQAELVGMLRADTDDASGRDRPRRLHARLAVENRGSTTITLLADLARVMPTSGAALEPADAAAIAIPPGARSALDLFFPLVAIPSIEDAALRDVALEWTVEIDGQRFTTRAAFHRVSAWLTPGWRDPWYGPWYGPAYGPWYDPWCDPWSPWNGGTGWRGCR